MRQFLFFLGILASVFASTQLIFSVVENEDHSIELLPNSTGVQRKLTKISNETVQIWHFCKSKSDKKCGYWSDENGKKIGDGKNSVTVERKEKAVLTVAALKNFHLGEDGEYIKYPLPANKETAYAQINFLFVVPKPPTAKPPTY